MLSTRSCADRNLVHKRLIRAILRHDHERAREIYYGQVLPNPAFDRREAERLSYRIGVIDEGDSYLAGRSDL